MSRLLYIPVALTRLAAHDRPPSLSRVALTCQPLLSPFPFARLSAGTVEFLAKGSTIA